MKKFIEIIFLFVILAGAYFLRINGLEQSPSTINWDEASLGYNAYSLLLTGKDEYGKPWPISLRSFSDYKPALYTILSVPFVKWWGLNQTSTRAVSAVAGTLSLIGIWMIMGLWIKNRYLKLLILTFLAIEPWRLHFSRTALETNLSASFFVFGVYFLFKSKIGDLIYSLKFIVLSLIFMVLSAYSYHSARLAAPILYFLFFIDPLIWFLNSKKTVIFKRIPWLVSIVIFGLMMIPVFTESKSDQVLTRFRQENVFVRYFPYAPSDLFKYDWESWLRLSPIYYLLGILFGHFAGYFSPVNFSTNVFLWIRKSVQYIPEFNLIGWWEVGLLIIGIMVLIRKIREDKYRWIFYWIIAAIAPAAVTWNWFHSLRILNAMPAIEILIVWGLLAILKYFKSYGKIMILGGILLIMFIWQGFFIVNNEMVYAVWENHGEYQPGGFVDGVPLVAKLLPDYDQVIIESPHAQSYIFFLFYQSYSPQIIQSYASSRTKVGPEGSWNFDFDKYHFRKIDWNVDKTLRKTILWLPAVIDESEVKKIPGAQVYFLKNPVGLYNSAMIVTLP